MIEAIPRPNRLKTEYKPFLIARISEAYVQKTESSRKIFDIYLSRDQYVAERGLDVNGLSINSWLQLLTDNQNPGEDYINNQISKLENSSPATQIQIASHEFPLRWAGAGTLLIFETAANERYAAVNERYPHAFHGGKLDANGGVSDSLVDWLTPGCLALRELSEEVIIIKNGKITFPTFTSSNKDNPRTKELLKSDETREKAKAVTEKTLGVNLEFEEMPIRNITPDASQDKLRIHFKGEVFDYEGLVIIDSEGGSLDIRDIYQAQIDSIDDIFLLDGETRYDKQKNSVLQGRKIILIKLDKLKNLSQNPQTPITPDVTFQNGVKVKNITKEYRLTPALSYISNSLFS